MNLKNSGYEGMVNFYNHIVELGELNSPLLLVISFSI